MLQLLTEAGTARAVRFQVGARVSAGRWAAHGNGRPRGLSCPLLLPVSTCTTWFFPFFPFFLVMNVGVPPAYREKQCALCFPGIFLTRYSSFVYQPRTILVVFLLLNLTVSLVNTGRWIIVSRKKKKKRKKKRKKKKRKTNPPSYVLGLHFLTTYHV